MSRRLRPVAAVLVLTAALAAPACRKEPAATMSTPSAPAPPSAPSAPAVLVEREADLAGHVGELVTLHGVVTNTKLPTLLGVDVASDSPDLRGREAWATGRLERFDEPPSEVGGVMQQSRGAGARLRLVDPQGAGLAPVRAAP